MIRRIPKPRSLDVVFAEVAGLAAGQLGEQRRVAHEHGVVRERTGRAAAMISTMNVGRPTYPDPLPRPAPAAVPSRREPLPRWTVPVVAAVVLLAAAVTGWLLWRWIDGLALADVEKKAAAQLDAVKIAASIAVAGGGLFALYLAARRQRTQELELQARHAELAHAEQDAAARRVTELYSNGVEQLGSDKAAVRLGGLYALERLAQDNPDRPTLRQTVVDVLAGYLRMPYTTPNDPPAEDADEPTHTRYEERVQEREVRLTAQRILTAHLRPGNDPDHPADTFWPDTDLDLTGATLINLDFRYCRPRHAQFSGARFTGDIRFGGARFVGFAVFNGATFAGATWFGGTMFDVDAVFTKARFTGPVWFDGARFARDAVFTKARFTGPARFGGARFDGFAVFNGAGFAGDAGFGGARFARNAGFDGTRFAGDAVFSGATFDEDAGFSGALIVHPVPEFSSWPRGWRPAGEHGPVEGREGTWHRLVHVDREAFPSSGQDPAPDPDDG
ncbi:pentapeptide repeat-containing protein [Actinosynnema sp. NPDC059335]|uniref:pentapeptide repeat-containing protein n=1 Tax=Actinosynnema sp. NPDC059335 TaxID=3346804 RepID=UPI003671E0EC